MNQISVEHHRGTIDKYHKSPHQFYFAGMRHSYKVTQLPTNSCVMMVDEHNTRRCIRQSRLISPVRTYTISTPSSHTGITSCCQHAANPLYGMGDELVSSNANSSTDNYHILSSSRTGCSGPPPCSTMQCPELWYTSRSASFISGQSQYFGSNNQQCNETINDTCTCFRKLRSSLKRLRSFRDGVFLITCTFSFIVATIIISMAFIGMTAKRKYFEMTNVDLFALVTAPAITNILQGLITASPAFQKRCTAKRLAVTILTCFLNLVVAGIFLYGFAIKVNKEVINKATMVFVFDMMFAVTLFIGSIASVSSVIRGIFLLHHARKRHIKQKTRRKKSLHKLINTRLDNSS